MSGPPPYGYRLEPTVIDGIRTKMMVADPEAAGCIRLMFDMYAQPQTSFGDIARYFSENGRTFSRATISRILRSPVYAQADLELYEFVKNQGASIVNDAADFTGTNGCYLYQGRDVPESKRVSLKDQILVIAPHEGLIPSETWLACQKRLLTNIRIMPTHKAQNTWLAGKLKCGRCGHALSSAVNKYGSRYLRCRKKADSQGCAGCGTLRVPDMEGYIYREMCCKMTEFQTLTGSSPAKANPKLTALKVSLARVETDIEKLLDTLTGANKTLLAYANTKIEELDAERQGLAKQISDLSAEGISPEHMERISGHLNNWDNVSFEDKREVADGLITKINATSESIQTQWKI
jgi:hypothetical protein